MSKKTLKEMKELIAKTREANGEPPAQKLVCPMPIGKRPKLKPEPVGNQEIPAPEVMPAPVPKKPKLFGPAKRDNRMEKRGRLPDGSFFLQRWNAAEQNWHGHLLPASPHSLWGAIMELIATADPHIFTSDASGVFRLLTNLDIIYREWLKENPA